ncbi:SMI1/KNR4 family protein [Roseimicrobium sp. ORNL1]|uniref:SMI1/KNR4 family protein n=1 Tax=Roseimicrobium sp. ORNL1 TaxID=2711231 RepID=UPI0013E16CB8|nr:SMI1/KNR4 family protein [Roseimicrobium sp. ORNL1]QIF03784.1 hypothetical protein G5S37_20415 [Roseimicrobium sp. ORNL1]
MNTDIKKIEYVARLQPAPASDSEIEGFQRNIPFPLSPTFVTYCLTQNGGIPLEKNNLFIPSKRHAQYWNMCGRRFINSAGQFDVNCLYGLTVDERCSILRWTENARRVRRLPDLFWVVASDGVGLEAVSQLTTGNDAVYLWEPNIEPHLFQMTDSLLEFYNSLEPETFEE